MLGIAKLAGAIVLLLPWLPTLKEWAYAGFTFTWIAATFAHCLAADGLSLLPVALLGLLAVSYVTRSANRRGLAKSMLAQGDGSIPLPASGPHGGIGRGVEDLRARRAVGNGGSWAMHAVPARGQSGLASSGSPAA